jgi:hypothetical protein
VRRKGKKQSFTCLLQISSSVMLWR